MQGYMDNLICGRILRISRQPGMTPVNLKRVQILEISKDYVIANIFKPP